MKKPLLVGVPLLCLVVVAPMLVAVVLVTLTGQAASCAPLTGGTPLAPPGTVGAGTVRVAHANLKVSLPAPQFTADLTATLAEGPDLVSLNEVARRADAALTPPGYRLWRTPDHGDDGTAVLWRADRWAAAARGRVMLVDHGPQKWDYDRAATWVTVRGTGENTAAGQVSMVSVHHMVNPAKYGPNRPLRQRLYRSGMERLRALVATLSTSGPVFVAGDFNSQWADDDPWGPRAMLGTAGGLPAALRMRTTMDVLAKEPTHDGGGTIDYILYQPAAATPTRQWTRGLNSDHRLLAADFTLRGVTATDVVPTVGTAADGADPDHTGEAPVLTATQWKRAAEVVGAGKAMGIPEQGIVIALAVASQESGFKVHANDGRGGDLAADQHGIERSLRLPHDAVGTDHGSLGVFQQQWPWWGSMTELMTPAVSARKFYTALLQVVGWQALPLTVAAQRVQNSAYPDAYADDEPLARQVYAVLADTPATDVYVASTARADCAIRTAAAGANTVVVPVPPHLAETDRRNWGGTGAHWSSWHTGTDFSVGCGTPVLAAHAGTVQIDTGQGWAGRWLVKVSTGPGQLTTWYAHSQKVLVTEGQAVTAGQQIGEAGAEGNATGCHLHFEVHLRGGSIYGPDNVDPSTWLAENTGRSP